MKTKTTALIASTLLTGLLAANASAASDATIITGVSSANLSAAVEAELFPTDQALSISGDRVNYSMVNTSVSDEVKAELFPNYNQ